MVLTAFRDDNFFVIYDYCSQNYILGTKVNQCLNGLKYNLHCAPPRPSKVNVENS